MSRIGVTLVLALLGTGWLAMTGCASTSPGDDPGQARTGFFGWVRRIDDADYADVVRVIDLPESCNGMRLDVAMDGDSQQALGYLAV